MLRAEGESAAAIPGELVYATADVDAYIDELQATIDGLRSELERRDQQLRDLYDAVELTFRASEEAVATLERNAENSSPGLGVSMASTSSAPHDDDMYFESLRRRIRMTH